MNLNNYEISLEINTVLGYLEEFNKNCEAINELEIEKNKMNSVTTKEIIDFHLRRHERNVKTNSNLKNILTENMNVFSKNKMDLGKSNIISHKICTGDINPIASLPRRIPQAYEDKVDALVEDLLKSGIIEESESPWNSPVVIVKKKNGDIRMCIDYRRLNMNTERPIYLIPDSKQIFDCLSGNAYFSTIDFSQGYYQVEMNNKDAEKTAFTTRTGHYHFLRMPFGLSSAPATFQKLMNKMLNEENWYSCLIYLDDIIIFGKNEDEHNARLRKILSKIREAGLKLSPFKCEFSLTEINFLGHTICKEGIKTDINKVKIISNWPKPTKENELVSFLGFCSYYRKFIKNYADLTASLEKICKKKSKDNLIWTPEAEKDFESLKQCLTSPPILSFPRTKGLFIIDCDASSVATGCVVSQIQDGEEKVIAYASNLLSKAEQKYCTTRRELLAVHRYILMFKHYLIGAHFQVRTDHKALTWLLGWQNPNTSQYARWKSDLEMFDFEVIYRKGSAHNNADFLSRPPCGQCHLLHPEPKSKRNVKVFDEDNNIDAMIFKVRLNQTYTQETQKNDENINTIIKLIKEKRKKEVLPQEIKGGDKDVQMLWKVRNKLELHDAKLVYRDENAKYRIVVPASKRIELIDTYHRAMCHYGSCKVLSRLSEIYFWPQMDFDVRKRIAMCKICQFAKQNKYGKAPAQSITTSYPFERICMDITGPLNMSKSGHRYILSVVDYFSRFPMLIPLKSIEAKDVAKALLKNWICVFGVPFTIHSDRGTNFESNLIYELCKWLGIVKTKSTPYHPTSNSLIERTFRTIKELIRCQMIQSGCQWDECLPLIEMNLRATISRTTTFSPYEVLFGKKMMTNLNSDFSVNKRKVLTESDYINWLIYQNKSVENKIKDIQSNSSVEQKVSHYTESYEIGQHVLVKKLNAKGFEKRFEGPFIVRMKLGRYSYRLENGEGRIVDRHHDHLKPYVQDSTDCVKSFKATTSIDSLSHKRSEITKKVNEPDTVTPRVNEPAVKAWRSSKRTMKPVERYGWVS